jgi:chemotaxis protein methyltransferase CheR
VVFCRNVLIYFDQETKIDIFERLAKIMSPDGFLVLGAAETVVGLTDTFKPLAEQRGLYVPNGSPSKTAAKTTPLGLAQPRLAVVGTR